MAPPPYLVKTKRLVLRCWDPADAPALAEAIESSLEHLRPWMPWAHAEPRPLDERIELLRGFRGRFDLGEDFVYGIFDRDGSAVLGGTGLHARVGEGGFEIGYWIRADRVGAGLATEAAAALTRVAFDLCGVDRVEIRVEPTNEPSAAIPRKLGYREEARLRRRLPGGEGEGLRDAVVFTLFRDEFPSSPAASARLDAFDAAGAQVL